ncbi:hypothetical protein [Shewanella nanhaiensis]|uniref:Uncharacterized protein n=1 Tax=Shewanella nanhaiensis TaxID=2864872 RepID=A0ABS7E0T4_9GAMM|nr:hypothetical protein [Shewanella nanhaiensis]MBW8183254.1 hypothetical protein [Shewanella nanhaiensis]
MIYFNNLQGRDYNSVYNETIKSRAQGDDPIIFDLDDTQIANAMNHDWQYVTKGQMAMVVQGDKKLNSTVYKITKIERIEDAITQSSGYLVRGAVISKLAVKGSRYNISFMLQGVSHKRLTDGCFQRDVNLISAENY